MGQLVPDGEDLGELLLILHHQNIGAAVGQHVLARLRRVGGIDAGGEAAREHAAQVREEPLRTVEADDADAVARLQAQLDEGLERKSSIALYSILPFLKMQMQYGESAAVLRICDILVRIRIWLRILLFSTYKMATNFLLLLLLFYFLKLHLLVYHFSKIKSHK